MSGVNVSTASVPDIAKLEVMENVGNVEWDLLDAGRHPDGTGG